MKIWKKRHVYRMLRTGKHDGKQKTNKEKKIKIKKKKQFLKVADNQRDANRKKEIVEWRGEM